MEILKQRPSRNPKEVLTFALLVFLSSITLLTTLGVILSLVGDVAQFFRRVPLTEFLFAPEWTPLFADPRYGISPLIAGTFLVTLIALLVAVPLGLALAIYLSEYASGAARARIKGTLELFEGIPTVVFGYFALLFVTPLLQRVIPDLNIFNPLSAGLVMGFAIIPYISNVAADAMESVPRSIREAAYALGARPYEVALRVVFPAAISGIIAAIILATSRAIGETKIVAIAAGQPHPHPGPAGDHRHHDQLHRPGGHRGPAHGLHRLLRPLRRGLHPLPPDPLPQHPGPVRGGTLPGAI